MFSTSHDVHCLSGNRLRGRDRYSTPLQRMFARESDSKYGTAATGLERSFGPESNGSGKSHIWPSPNAFGPERPSPHSTPGLGPIPNPQTAHSTILILGVFANSPLMTPAHPLDHS